MASAMKSRLSQRKSSEPGKCPPASIAVTLGSSTMDYAYRALVED